MYTVQAAFWTNNIFTRNMFLSFFLDYIFGRFFPNWRNVTETFITFDCQFTSLVYIGVVDKLRSRQDGRTYQAVESEFEVVKIPGR